MSIEVSGLYTYPIKSCAGIELETAELTELGLAYDREWMLVNDKDVFLTQRVKGELALVQTRLSSDSLVITAPGHGEFRLPLDASEVDGKEVEVNVFKKTGSGRDQGKEAADFFSGYLDKQVRLLRILSAREIKPETQVAGASRHTAFADGFSITLASTSSLAELNKHMSDPVGMERFRPNVVVSGAELPAYEEDYWRVLRIGNLKAYVVRACARCPVPNIDQQTGVLPKPAQRHVTQALRNTRRGIDTFKGTEEEFFMQNLAHVFEEGASVSRGDEVQVLERADERNFGQLTDEASLSGLSPQPGRRQRRPVSE